jgi:hypothetical protein
MFADFERLPLTSRAKPQSAHHTIGSSRPTFQVQDTKAFENRPSLRSRLHMGHVKYILKSYKSCINSVNLKLSDKGRDASPLSYLYLYRIFKCFLIKLCKFQNRV